MSIDDDSTTRWANAATTPEIHHQNAKEEDDDDDNDDNSRAQHHGYAVGRRSPIGEELEILQTSMRSLRRKQFSRDRKQALNKVQFDGEGRPAIELQQSKEKTSAKRPLGNGNQPQKQDEGPAQISRSYSTIRLVKQSSTKSGTRPNGSPVLPFKDPASQFWGSPNKGKHAVSAAHRSMTTRPLPPIPRSAIEPYQGTRRVPDSHDFDFHMAEEREHHEKQDNSDDEWTKEESAIFEMLDNLDSSFSATSRADESMGDSSFEELSFANGYKEFLGGENTGRGDADRANSFSGVFADNIPAIERKTSRRRSSRDVSIQLDGVQRSLAKRSVASRGLIRRKAAQEDLRKAMRGQVARSSLNEAPHASEGDWEMVERSMAQSHGELKDGNLRMFGIRSGFRTLGKERAKAGRKENLRSAPYRRPTLKSIISPQEDLPRSVTETYSARIEHGALAAPPSDRPRSRTLRRQRSFSSPAGVRQPKRTIKAAYTSAMKTKSSASKAASKSYSSGLLSLGSIRKTFSMRG